jgi:hypothetical protein
VSDKERKWLGLAWIGTIFLVFGTPTLMTAHNADLRAAAATHQLE